MSMMVIQHNMLAMNGNRMFGITTGKQAKSSEKLSSGYKINRAADDAAGLSISEKMRRQIRGLTQGAYNIQDGISVCQIADGALHETHDILQRMNELAVKSANGTLSEEDREYTQQEVANLIEEVDRIANTTVFNEQVYPLKGEEKYSKIVSSPNGQKWALTQLTNSTEDVTIRQEKTIDGNGGFRYHTANVDGNTIGYGDTVSVDVVRFDKYPENPLVEIWEVNSNGKAVDVPLHHNKLYLAMNDDHDYVYDVSELFVKSISVDYFHVDDEGRIYVNPSYDSSSAYYLTEGKGNPLNPNDKSYLFGTIRDFVGGWEKAEKNNMYVRIKATPVSSDINVDDKGFANVSENKNIWIQSGTESTHGFYMQLVDATATTIGVKDVDVSTPENALAAIDKVKGGLHKISEYRTIFGAQQNRMEHAYNSNMNTVENTQASESRIRDTDMALEMVSYSNNNILAQAGQSMLANANQSKQGILSLLQ